MVNKVALLRGAAPFYNGSDNTEAIYEGVEPFALSHPENSLKGIQ